MSYASLLVHTATIKRAATVTNDYGDSRPDWAAATSTTSPARFVQRSATEELGERDAEVSEWVAYLPAGVDLVATDRLEWGSYVFEVSGLPLAAVRRSADVHHIEAQLRLIEG